MAGRSLAAFAPDIWSMKILSSSTPAARSSWTCIAAVWSVELTRAYASFSALPFP